jgi:biopolymer transport protein ExbD
MKRKHTLSQRKFKTDDPKLDISSLVDVSFLLLIFFLVATSIVRTEQDLTIQQGCERKKISRMEVIRINLDKDGEIILKSGKNEEIVELSGSGSDLLTLKARLDLVRDLSWKGPTVHVRSDEGSEYQRFIDILNCLAEVKINSVGIVDSTETFQ